MHPLPLSDNAHCNAAAIRFQRLAIAALALASLLFQRVEPLYPILANSALGFLSTRLAPFILLYHLLAAILHRPVLRPAVLRKNAFVLFSQPPVLDRFIHGLFAMVTTLLILLAPHFPLFVWAFSGYMAVMMFLSGTVGFCMGAVFYALTLGLLRKLGIPVAQWKT